jgi:hypothetical protein
MATMCEKFHGAVLLIVNHAVVAVLAPIVPKSYSRVGKCSG